MLEPELVEELRNDARGKLLDLLDEVTGRKVLVLDSTIIGPLNLIVSTSDLKDHGVQQFFLLGRDAVTTECTQMIFLVRCARVELVDWISSQILADEVQGRDRMYVVVFMPRKTEQCLERLGRGNVRANVRTVECGLHFFPFDRDVLSMEMPAVFSEYHVQGDPSGVFYAAKALMLLQSKFGVIPSVHAVGVAGKIVVDIMLRLKKEEEALNEAQQPARELSQKGVPPVAPHAPPLGDTASSSRARGGPKISEVVIIDRRVDLFSVLCSQFTYQALIDMVFGIQNSLVDLSSAAWHKEKEQKVRLSHDDALYKEIRDLHIDRLGPLLQQKATAIQQTYSEKDNVKSSMEMAEYIKKFKVAQSAHPLLAIHINLAHDLRDAIQQEEYRNQLRLEDDITAQSSQINLEMIEDYIDDRRPLHEVLRLLCLYSLVNNGVKAKQLDQLKKGIIQAYGYEHLLTLCNMEKVGILRYQQGKSVWSSVKRQFNLFVDDAAADKDISYAYSGYAPLSVRLVQMTKSLPKGWRSCQDALGLLDGPTFEVSQVSPADAKEPAVVAVLFLGGVTYGEIAALRRLSELEEGRRKFLIITTEFLNTKKLFTSLRCEDVFKQGPVEVRKKSEPQPKRFGFWPGGRG